MFKLLRVLSVSWTKLRHLVLFTFCWNLTYKNTLPVFIKHCQTHELQLISISRADFSFHHLSPAKADNRAGGACAPLPPQSPLAFRAVRTCNSSLISQKKYTNNQPIYYSDVLVIRKSVV